MRPSSGAIVDKYKTLTSMDIFSGFALKKPAEWRVWFSVVFRLVCSTLATAAACMAGAAFFLASAIVVSSAANAQVQTPEASLPSPAVAKRLRTLESELRCLVCQNQTLADSPAGLAGDLRREVRSLVEQGKSDAEIKAFLRARYGDFVLYKPPVDPKTYLLWFGPFGLLIIGGVSGWLVARRRGLAAKASKQAGEVASTRDGSVPASTRQRAKALLDDDIADKEANR
ncbi:MAG: cytochrome c-type biogenesis protein [Burkholderiales bacterium]